MIKHLKKKIKLSKIKKDYKKDAAGKYQSGLINIYKSHFKTLKYKKINLLEIGIDQGGSLLYWSDYFKHPEMTITGLDINLPAVEFPDKVTVYKCDQNDTAGIKAIADKHGPFDIIVDDGAHMLKETENCFSNLWEYIIPGGFYVIEDWSVGYMGGAFSGMSEYVADLIKNSLSYNIREFWTHWDKQSSTAIFRKKGTEPEIVPSFLKKYEK